MYPYFLRQTNLPNRTMDVKMEIIFRDSLPFIFHKISPKYKKYLVASKKINVKKSVRVWRARASASAHTRSYMYMHADPS